MFFKGVQATHRVFFSDASGPFALRGHAGHIEAQAAGLGHSLNFPSSKGLTQMKTLPDKMMITLIPNLEPSVLMPPSYAARLQGNGIFKREPLSLTAGGCKVSSTYV